MPRTNLNPTASAVMLACGVALAWTTPWAQAADAAPAAAAASSPDASPVFAKVGNTSITLADYQRSLAVAMRKKYYHAKPPEAELAKFQREVADDVVNRVLLLTEASRRGVEPDREQIAATIAGYDKQYATSPNWKTNRDKMLAAVVPQLETESRLARLESQIRTIPDPTEAQLRGYYDANKKLFVEPEQVKLSVILLKVDPSSRAPVWEAAREEGRQIHRRLKAGANFEEVARLHSGDRSAAQGGQMEYMHRGMLPEPVQAKIDAMKLGDVAEPVQLLEGITILRLDGKKPAQQRSLEDVRERAVALWKRDRSNAAWASFIEGLRKGVAIRVDESHLVPLPRMADKPKAG